MKNVNETDIHIRIAEPEDAEALLAVYAPYVEETAITFEYAVPSVEEFQKRIRNTLQQYPYLVAEDENGILGYAYAGRFQSRAAYDWAVETSIYIRKDQKGRGLGRRLYHALEEGLKEQGILNVNACITYIEKEDEYVTKNSAQFHEHMGYRLVGKFCACGYKFGRWYDMIWMEKFLGEHTAHPAAVKRFPEIKKQFEIEYCFGKKF